jgi:hypothetical protein
MSSVSHIRYSPPEGVQMVETEEIRFKIGDACCSIANQDYDVRDDLVRRHNSLWPLQGHKTSDLGTGRAFVERIKLAIVVLSWKHEEIARRACMRHAVPG